MDFYHPSICHICKSSKNLKLCGKCKCLSYCSKEHQILDWPSHKSLCRVICDTDEEYTVEVQNALEDLTLRNISTRGEYTFTIWDEWENKLGRVLKPYERAISMFRPSCSVCNSRDTPIMCKLCLSVFYCSLEHQSIHAEKHGAFCASIKLSYDFLPIIHSGLLKISPKLLEKEICLQVLPNNLMKLMKFLEDGSHISVPKNMGVLEHISMRDALAPVANILFGLEKANLLKNQMLPKNDLVVHIVGADLEELTWNWNFLSEFTFHWIKHLKKLSLVVIGPELDPCNFSLSNTPASICGFCNMNHFNSKCFFHSDYYHAVIDVLEKPDMVVAFNCGINSFPSWIPSIPSLIKYPDVPLVLTDYNLELIMENVELIEKHAKKATKVILRPQRNPFSYLRPERSDFKIEPIVYNDAYIAILKSE